jgi:hypothetical protein
MATSLLLAGASLALAGCAFLAPAPEASGPCTFKVSAAELGVIRPMDPPYSLVMTPPSKAFEFGDASVVVSGGGWRMVKVTSIAPSGVVDTFDVPGRILSGDLLLPAGVPGTWRFRLSDDEAGCVRAFSVDVRAAGQP